MDALKVDYVLFTHYAPRMGLLKLIEKILHHRGENLIFKPEEIIEELKERFDDILEKFKKSEMYTSKVDEIDRIFKRLKMITTIKEDPVAYKKLEEDYTQFQHEISVLYPPLKNKKELGENEKQKYEAIKTFIEPSVECDIAFLKYYKYELKNLLSEKEKFGILIIFYDPGWLELQNTVGLDFNPKKFADELNKALEFQEEIYKEFKVVTMSNDKGRNLLERIRIVTANDLCPIINNLRGDRPGLEATKLRRFLGERAKGMRYDTSKVVEAIIRLRNLGSGLPVFRIDWDALFNPESIGKLQGTAINSAITTHVKKLGDSRIYSFLFSGGYNYPVKPTKSWEIGDWLKAFATRIFPALKVIPKLKEIGKDDEVTDALLKEVLDWKVALKFYGVSEAEYDPLKLQEESKVENGVLVPVGGTTTYGSNPVKSVISGALLCLSDSAILDLPPFSNFRLNVMWIDDHLKYALHRELGHFLEKKDFLVESRVKHCALTKDRAPIKSICVYVMGTYLPTLLWGAIMDAWIQPDPRLNLEFIEDPEKRPKPGIFSRVLSKAVERGYIQESLQPGDRARLVEEFREEAYKRVKTVQSSWRELKYGEEHSFASLWAGETPKNIIKAISNDPGQYIINEQKQDKNWIGFGLTTDGKLVEDGKNLRKCVVDEIEKLIDDVINYIEWTLEWPRFVQSVRSVRQGSLPMDLNWKPPRT